MVTKINFENEIMIKSTKFKFSYSFDEENFTSPFLDFKECDAVFVSLPFMETI